MSTQVRKPAVLAEVTVDAAAAAYGDGDTVGTPQEVTDAVLEHGGTATLQSVLLHDAAAQTVAVVLYFFDELPTVSADNAAFSVSDAEMSDKFLGRVSITPTAAGSAGSAGQAVNVGLKLRAANVTQRSKSVYVVAVTSGGTPTYTADSITLKLGIDQD